MKEPRRSGLLLHPTSLAGPWGIGDLGAGARSFVDFLAAAGQTIWQVLPLCPTDGALGESPYSSPSALAGNLLLLSPEDLVEAGWIDGLPPQQQGDRSRVDFRWARRMKTGLVEAAFGRFLGGGKEEEKVASFCRHQAWWLDEHCLFEELKAHHGGLPWTAWDEPYRNRRPEALEAFRREREKELLRRAFGQYLFQTQWDRLCACGRSRGVLFWGDLPIYPSLDSADVWSRPDLFRLDEGGRPLAVAGVPPDYFSETGQLWGNPLYRWEAHREEGFRWWVGRMTRLLQLFDRIRIDHFRGLLGYWAVPSGASWASEGHWEEGPGQLLLQALSEAFPARPFLAENLGVITDDVTEAMERFGLPGMIVLLFAWSSAATNAYAPHNHGEGNVVYTGTHDNNTARGWWEQEAGAEERDSLAAYLGLKKASSLSGEEAAFHLLRLAQTSVARWAITPVQDLLGLDGGSRMNRPGKGWGNWSWRLSGEERAQEAGERLRALTGLTGRAGPFQPLVGGNNI
ncbi:MAG: 4-alpha-glucanotransferase [Synergistaceae bacterium]|nr:4-alpha-glucanotransferase [Synergistaceae bacterium]